MKLLFIGKQASGKGTIAEIIKERYGLCHISTGDLMRDTAQQDTELGRKIKGLIDGGNFVPDDVAIIAVKKKLGDLDCKKGFILDGFPRDLNQAEEMEKISKLDRVILLHLTDEIVMHRLEGRRQCKTCHAVYNVNPDGVPKPGVEGKCDKCGGELFKRKDDEPEYIKKRLATYKEKTMPLIEFYREKGVLLKVDANQAIDKVVRAVEGDLGSI